MFSVKGSKEYAGIFLFSKFELYWAAFIFVKIHNRQIGIWIEHFFQKFSDDFAWEHFINQDFLIVLSKREMGLLNFREELNKKQNCTTNHNCHAMFTVKCSKEYAGIF